MAKIYSSDVAEPKYDYSKTDWDSIQKVDDKYIADVKADLVAKGFTGSLVGEVVSFPYADGAAFYMVASLRPVALIHLPIGDAWRLPDAHERGLTAKDLRKHVESAKALSQIFGGNRE